jgi:hypothetical protein
MTLVQSATSAFVQSATSALSLLACEFGPQALWNGKLQRRSGNDAVRCGISHIRGDNTLKIR